MIQNLIDTHFHLDYYKNHQQVYLRSKSRCNSWTGYAG